MLYYIASLRVSASRSAIASDVRAARSPAWYRSNMRLSTQVYINANYVEHAHKIRKKITYAELLTNIEFVALSDIYNVTFSVSAHQGIYNKSFSFHMISIII